MFSGSAFWFREQDSEIPKGQEIKVHLRRFLDFHPQAEEAFDKMLFSLGLPEMLNVIQDIAFWKPPAAWDFQCSRQNACT
jgi:hypothetical protein